MKAQAIKMPAFRAVLAPGEVELLVDYVRQVSGMIEPPEGPARVGFEIADRMGCFGCHGPLVRDRGELREWIREGSLGRVNEHWIGGHYARRQRIQMPAYKEIVKDEELEPLMDFVEWVASGQIAHAPMS